MKVLVFPENDHNIPRRYWQYSVPILKQKGIDVHFATVRGREELHEIFEKEHGIPTHVFNGKKAPDYFRVARDLRRFLKDENFEVVHAAEAIAASIAGLACLKLPGTKCIYHYHHIIPTSKRQKFLSAVASRLADLVMPVSNATQRACIEYDKVAPPMSMVAYNGTEPLREVSPDEVDAIKRELNIPDRALVISLVARLRHEKGHKTLFEAAGIAAASESRPIHLVVTGDGPERAELQETVKAYSNIKVHFTGNRDDIAPWFYVGDIIAVPSYSEPFGLVAIEAMSCGKPLIASDVQGLAEIVENGINGILVPPGDPARLAEAILRVSNDPELAKNLSENGPRRVNENFTVVAMAEGWIRCYEKTLRISLDE